MTEQNENQAIEEMATIIAGTERVVLDVVGAPPSANMLAKAVYFAGYRKQIEGEWIAKREMYRTPTAKNYYCSNCEKYAISDTFLGVSKQTNYCPNCGAKMKRR